MISRPSIPASQREQAKQKRKLPSEQGIGKKPKLVSCSTMMTKSEICCLSFLFVVIMILAIIVSSFASDMLIYDEGDVYSCPVDHINSKLAEHFEVKLDDDEGKRFRVDPISHEKYEDMFYDPMACQPFYKTSEEPIWYGRVDGLRPVNQKLLVYGFVTSKLNENYDGELLRLEYYMHIRGKNSKDEEWNYLNDDTEEPKF